MMQMYNLTGYNDNYSETSGSLWQYYKDEKIDDITDYESFKLKTKTTGSTSFWMNFEMPRINYDIIILLSWYENQVISAENGAQHLQ